VNPANARALVPPRPNLGPEPWSEAGPITLYVAIATALTALLVGWIVWTKLARARTRRRARNSSSRQGPYDTSPRGRLVALSHSMRDVLADQFGAAWRAKTNEELSAEPLLLESLGHDQLQELIQFLVDIDRLKFAPNRSNHQQVSLEEQLAAWEPRLADLGAKIKAKPERRPKNGAAASNSRTTAPSLSLAGNTKTPQP
jgi:hypothetical protein